MNAEPAKKKSTGTVVTLLVIMPVLYVLSAGPVWRIYYGRSEPETINRFYYPLEWAVVHSTWVEKAMGVYLRLWGAEYIELVWRLRALSNE